ncbi:MAG: NUDIX hydrolase [Pseudonocardia sp.]
MSDPPVPIRRAAEVRAFENSFGTLYDDHVVGPTGARGRYLRWEWGGLGVVVIPVHADTVGLWHMYRYPVSSSSWEFPRGSIEDDETAGAAALRELKQEAGVVGRDPETIGSLFAETGLIGTPVTVVAVVVDDRSVEAPEAEPMESVAGRGRWLAGPEFQAAVAGQEVHCALTIAAWTMLIARKHL